MVSTFFTDCTCRTSVFCKGACIPAIIWLCCQVMLIKYGANSFTYSMSRTSVFQLYTSHCVCLAVLPSHVNQGANIFTKSTIDMHMTLLYLYHVHVPAEQHKCSLLHMQMQGTNYNKNTILGLCLIQEQHTKVHM